MLSLCVLRSWTVCTTLMAFVSTWNEEYRTVLRLHGYTLQICQYYTIHVAYTFLARPVINTDQMRWKWIDLSPHSCVRESLLSDATYTTSGRVKTRLCSLGRVFKNTSVQYGRCTEAYMAHDYILQCVIRPEKPERSLLFALTTTQQAPSLWHTCSMCTRHVSLSYLFLANEMRTNCSMRWWVQKKKTSLLHTLCLNSKCMPTHSSQI